MYDNSSAYRDKIQIFPFSVAYKKCNEEKKTAFMQHAHVLRIYSCMFAVD